MKKNKINIKLVSKNTFNLLVLAVLLSWIGCSVPTPVIQTQLTGEARVPYNVTLQSVSPKADSIRWDLGDGTQSVDSVVTHRFRRSGETKVTLTSYKGKKQKTVTQTIQLLAPQTCLVEMETPFGSMLIELFDATPQHRDNFVKLAQQGYFDSLLFHRVIEGFMIQGGDPNSKNAPANAQLGSGGPGYTIPAEFVDSLFHLKGYLAAARTGDGMNPQKRSSGSQFYLVQGRPVTEAQLLQMESNKGIRYPSKVKNAYITQGGTPFLDREYTVFGRVVQGIEVIDKIANQPTSRGDRPQTNVWMKVYAIY